MKHILASVIAAFALVFSAGAADYTAKITDVHLCCGKCVSKAEKTVAAAGAKAVADKDDGTVTITAPDKATAQKAADALVAGGYYGKSADVTLAAMTGAKDEKVQSLTVSGVHLCCGSCVKTTDKIVKSVPGVTGDDAAVGAKSFTVTGDFNEKALFDALQKGGLTGKVAAK